MLPYDYSRFSYFGHLCEVPIDVLNNLNEYFDKHCLSNSPSTDNGTYKQWYTQTARISKKDNHNNDTSWLYWQDDNFLQPTKDFFNKYVSKIYRFRFSLLDKDHNVDYHRKHMLPRIHIPLNDSGSIFVIKDDHGIEHEYELSYGSAHFINVTYYHKITNIRNIERRNSFFSLVNFRDKKVQEMFYKS